MFAFFRFPSASSAQCRIHRFDVIFGQSAGNRPGHNSQQVNLDGRKRPGVVTRPEPLKSHRSALDSSLGGYKPNHDSLGNRRSIFT